MNKPQVESTHYFSDSYLSQARFISLHKQVNLCLQYPANTSILEIGPGPKLFSAIMSNLGYKIFTVDFDISLQPDINGCLPKLPFADESFDISCAFEVMEHLPYSLLASNLLELRRITKNRIYFSVPDQKYLGKKKFSISISFPKRSWSKILWRQPLNEITNPQEHFWELSFNVTTEEVIRVCTDIGLKVTDHYLVKPYFHFFELGW